MKGYIVFGNHDTRMVLFDGVPLDPRPSQLVWNHSPDGFNWGYGGSGPAQLALAILLKVGLSDGRAARLHQEFKDDFIAGAKDGDAIPISSVMEWIAQREDEK